MIDYYSVSIAEARRYGRVCELPEGFRGISVWSLPLSSYDAEKKSDAKKAFIQSRMGAEAFQTYSDICCSMARQTEAVTEKTDWYLSIAGISPAYQSQGFGPQIIRPVLTEADAADIGSYLETFTERNMPFYARLGYQVIASFEEPVIGARYWVMRRPPAG
ncbi:MAG: GNAT family N-acetyltransferase [Pseudomonadota bacterium]